MTNILLVDDDQEIRQLMEIYLKNEGYHIYQAENGREALQLVEKNDIDLIILDVMMPEMDGISACIQIRQTMQMPIIMVSAKGEDIDKIQGLTTGADDYVVKPFNPLELVARVKSQLRRYHSYAQTQSNQNEIIIGDIIINTSNHEVAIRGANVKLTKLEFDILVLLAENRGIVFSADKIYERVWNDPPIEAQNTVMVHIRKIREKLELNHVIHNILKRYGEWAIKLRKIKQLFKGSLRLQLILISIISIIIGYFSFIIAHKMNWDLVESEMTSYPEPTEVHIINQGIIYELHNNSFKINNIIEEQEKSHNVTTYLTDLNGKVIAQSGNDAKTYIDIYEVHEKISERVFNVTYPETYAIDPLIWEGKKSYLVSVKEPFLEKSHSVRYDKTAPFTGIFMFLLTFFLFTNSKMRQIRVITQGVRKIAEGKLHYKIEVKGQDELARLTSDINKMASDLNDKINAERELERSKQELITNVSHDLRTPLTSVLGYLHILKDQKYETNEEKQHYLSIVLNKANSLKNLIDQLFEYTKLTSHDVKLNKETFSFPQLLTQLIEELKPYAEDNDKIFHLLNVEKEVLISADPNKLVRVFENLLTNAVKYSKDDEVISVNIEVHNSDILVKMTNKIDTLKQQSMSKLFERFYKGDQSRKHAGNSSGLGLAIAKSIVELHDGQIWAETDHDFITFFVKLPINNQASTRFYK